jgi:hypothetical protein
MKSSLIPVKNILRTIRSSQTNEDINNCKKLIINYIKTAKKYEVLNMNDLEEVLNDQLLERQEELYLVSIFT